MNTRNIPTRESISIDEKFSMTINTMNIIMKAPKPKEMEIETLIERHSQSLMFPFLPFEGGSRSIEIISEIFDYGD